MSSRVQHFQEAFAGRKPRYLREGSSEKRDIDPFIQYKKNKHTSLALGKLKSSVRMVQAKVSKRVFNDLEMSSIGEYPSTTNVRNGVGPSSRNVRADAPFRLSGYRGSKHSSRQSIFGSSGIKSKQTTTNLIQLGEEILEEEKQNTLPSQPSVSMSSEKPFYEMKDDGMAKFRPKEDYDSKVMRIKLV